MGGFKKAWLGGQPPQTSKLAKPAASPNQKLFGGQKSWQKIQNI